MADVDPRDGMEQIFAKIAAKMTIHNGSVQVGYMYDDHEHCQMQVNMHRQHLV